MSSAIDQICFTNESTCSAFVGHMLKANMCINCMKEIAKHNRNSVKEEDLIKALECTQKGEKVPSLILDKEGEHGKLFLGGFKAAINKDFIEKENFKGVVNTVGSGLFTLFGRKFESTYRDAMTSNDICLLETEWEDSLTYNISEDDLALVIRHIHKVRSGGGSVLVHCAQGKSRSTTAVVAYIMVLRKTNLSDTYALVKEKRKMAEPNRHFMEFLKKFENSELLSNLHQELTT